MGKENSVPKRETHKRINASSTIPPDSSLSMVEKVFLRVHSKCVCVYEFVYIIGQN
jgi:hypothetical protein